MTAKPQQELPEVPVYWEGSEPMMSAKLKSVFEVIFKLQIFGLITATNAQKQYFIIENVDYKLPYYELLFIGNHICIKSCITDTLLKLWIKTQLINRVGSYDKIYSFMEIV